MFPPKLQVLNTETENQIIDEGIALLENPGVIIPNQDALELLRDAGARVNLGTKLVQIPEDITRTSLKSCPPRFTLYNLAGEAAVLYGSDRVHFAPGSSALTVLDRESQQIRQAETGDLISFIKITEILKQFDAQSTAMVCSDVPPEIADLYRLYLVLSYSSKAIITGAFQIETWHTMREMLEVASGGKRNLQAKPLAVFDVCPSSPLSWSDITCQNLLDCARAGIPVQIIAMPMAGATAPVTLAGTVVLHTAECLSGIVLSQTARPGAAVVWGGSPAIFDMKTGTPPLGAAGSWLLGVAYTQIGRRLGLPTQIFMGLSDAKLLDAQAGLEGAAGTLLAALAGSNLVTGAGMLDFENCHSLEKLVLDAEIIGLAQQFISGITLREDPIALNLVREIGHQSDFISHQHTFQWFRQENYYPSPVIDRQPLEGWINNGSLSTWQRARHQADLLERRYQPAGLEGQAREELGRITRQAAAESGLDRLPPLPAGSA